MRKAAEQIELSPREQQLIALAGKGMTDTAIANRLGISEATVNTYWGRIRVKLGPHNRTELVALALRDEYEKKLREAPDYSLILQAAPDALILANEEGTIQDANLAAAEMFGYEIRDMVGMSLESLIPARFRPNHESHMAGYLSRPERRAMAHNIGAIGLRKDDTEFPMAAVLSAVNLNGKSMAICSIRPVAA
jgi:PAS domain S-box-containing protein